MWDAEPRVHNLPGALSLSALVRYLPLDMLPRPRTLPLGFIPPCLPTKAPRPMWLHEIKHDRFRVIAREDGARVKLYSRPGNDLTWRFSLIVESLGRLRSRSCIIDGEAVAASRFLPASRNSVDHRS
jgi:ATP-dependent DNA ligase